MVGHVVRAAHLAIAPRNKLIDHVTIVIMENHSFENIIGNQQAPYINQLAKSGLLLRNSYAVAHPSEPNYVALYSGSTQGLRSDACPVNFNGLSLGGEALAYHSSIKGYMEDIPGIGSTVCESGEYVRKHNPLIDFADTPVEHSVPYTQIASDLRSGAYPGIAIVIPNMVHDMHDGTVAMGDAWLATNLPPILAFDASHKGMLILTWDEDNHDADNHIATIAIGPMVKAGQSNQLVNHLSVLRTITDIFGLPALTDAGPISSLTH
jgi:acid phosphatase